jgi:hypothetical protein
MSEKIARLLSVGSSSLAIAPVIAVRTGATFFDVLSSHLGQELLKLLNERNGFYAFESALLVRPFDCDIFPLGITQWNSETLWKNNYKNNLGDAVFFAEDIFGIQFGIQNGAIHSFDPETAEQKTIATSLEAWAGWVLEDYKTRTGWPMAHFWQLRHGELKPGTRLLPKIPFVLGGQFAIENLHPLNDVEGMRFRASVANQLQDCPDGSKVKLSIKHE